MKETTFHPAPVWLTKEYVESILRRYKQDNELIVNKLQIKPAIAKGENYASVMTRITVEFQLTGRQAPQQRSYIAKTTHENDPIIGNMMHEYGVDKTEMLMYEKILPLLTKVLHEIGDQDKLFADTIYVDYEHSAIIFEDLAVSQFVIADRLVGLDEIHSKLVLKKLAKMHAAAAVCNERMPGVLNKLDRGVFNRHTLGLASYFENMIEVCANYAGECEELGTYYKDKLLKLKSKVVEYARRSNDAHEGYFNTLVHGDVWTNNIMLRYGNDGQKNGTTAVEDILFVDFQFSAWSSPAVDLHYFFNTSLQKDLRMQREDELVQYYHTILVHTLRQLNFGGYIPSLHDFCIQMEACRFYAVTSALAVHPVMINDKTDDADFNNLIGHNERASNFRNILYTNKAVQENVKALLPFFDRRGLLDVTD